MENQFQTKTFPNHWSIVTGLYEESHGVIANKFYDRTIGKKFSLNTKVWENEPRFWGGEPIWTTNQKQGGKSGVQFWPGSELLGQTPTFYSKYNESQSFTERVDKFVDYLKLWFLFEQK